MATMLGLIKIISIVSLIVCKANSLNVTRFFEDLQNGIEWVDLENRFSEGSMRGYFTYQEVKDLVYKAKELFPNYILDIQTIGYTIERRQILAIALGINKGNNTANFQKSSMVFTGLHHAREPLSISANLYILFKNLHQLLAGNETTKRLLENNIMWFIPLVNVDGYEFIHNEYLKTNILNDKVRKNRRDVGCSSSYDQGVDLNRNYAFKFAYENVDGSSDQHCSDMYHGAAAFSEPETQAIRDFLLKHKKYVKTVLNFHAYGNLWIEPYNYEKDPDNTRLLRNTTAYKLYDEFNNEANFSGKYKVGNAAKAIDYIANGEASDWILGELGIFVLSPELGLGDFESEKFYPESSYISNILVSNYKTIEYLIYKFDLIPKFDYCETFSRNETQTLFKDDNWKELILGLEKDEKSAYVLYTCQIFNKGVGTTTVPLRVDIKAFIDETELKNANLEVTKAFKNDMSEEYWLNRAPEDSPLVPDSNFRSPDVFYGDRLDLNVIKDKQSFNGFDIRDIELKGRTFHRLSFIISKRNDSSSIILPTKAELQLSFGELETKISSGRRPLIWEISTQVEKPVEPVNKRSFLIAPMVFIMVFVGILLCLIFVYQFWKRKKKDEERQLLRMREVDSSNIDIEMMSDSREATSSNSSRDAKARS